MAHKFKTQGGEVFCTKCGIDHAFSGPCNELPLKHSFVKQKGIIFFKKCGAVAHGAGIYGTCYDEGYVHNFKLSSDGVIRCTKCGVDNSLSYRRCVK